MGITPLVSSTEPLQGRVLASSNTGVFASMYFHGDSLTPFLGRPVPVTLGTSKLAWDMPYQNTILSLCCSLSVTVAQKVFHDLFLTHQSHGFIDISIVSTFPCSLDTINNLDIASAVSIASAGPQGLCPALGCSDLGIVIILQRIVHL